MPKVVNEDWVYPKKAINAYDFWGSFKGDSMVGVLVEVRDGGVKRVVLVGDVNVNRGVCDDCTGVSGTASVIRHRRIWRK